MLIGYFANDIAENGSRLYVWNVSGHTLAYSAQKLSSECATGVIKPEVLSFKLAHLHEANHECVAHKQGSCGRCDLPEGDFETIVKSIKEKLFSLPEEIEVYPGHGGKTTIAHEKKFNDIINY